MEYISKMVSDQKHSINNVSSEAILAERIQCLEKKLDIIILPSSKGESLKGDLKM